MERQAFVSDIFPSSHGDASNVNPSASNFKRYLWTVLPLEPTLIQEIVIQQFRIMNLSLSSDRKEEAVMQWSNYEGWLPLMCAARYGNQTAIADFLREDVSLSERNKRGQTALMLAAFYGHMECVVLLVEAGANVNACDYRGWNSLFYATSAGRHEIVHYLLQKESDVNLYDVCFGMSPLMLAAASGHDLIVKSLMQHDANAGACSLTEKNALFFALQSNHQKVVDIIKEYASSVKSSSPSDFLLTNEEYSMTVEKILERLGLSKYYPLFETQKIDFNRFLNLTDKDLIDLGLKLLGPRRKITNEIIRWWEHIRVLREEKDVPLEKYPATSPLFDRLAQETQNLEERVTLLNKHLAVTKTEEEISPEHYHQLLENYSKCAVTMQESFSKYHLRDGLHQIQNILSHREEADDATFINELKQNVSFILSTINGVECYIEEFNNNALSIKNAISKLLSE